MQDCGREPAARLLGQALHGGLRQIGRVNCRSPHRRFSLSMLWLIGLLAQPGLLQAAAKTEVYSTWQAAVADQRTDTVAVSSPAPRAVNGAGKSENAAKIAAPALPAISIADAQIAEGHSGTSSMIFTLRLSSRNLKPVTVDYTTVDGSATAPQDYSARQGTVTFPRRTQEQTISVPITGDALVESDESFSVQLTNPTNATISRAAGEGIIHNDDQLPLPTATTTTAAGVEDEYTTITLDGSDAAYPQATLQATITTLPGQGQLAQMNGTPITQPGTLVTDSERRVRFLGGSHENGDPYTTFGYTVTSGGSGLTSAPGIVAVSLTPAPDAPATVANFRPTTQEETPVIFALPGSDPDGDALTAFVVPPPASRGILYQVLADGKTAGPQITANAWVQVTNPDRLVRYEPPRNAHGLPLTIVNYYLQDSTGLISVPGPERGGEPVFIDVTNVNDAPVGMPMVHLGSSTISVVPVSLRYHDADLEALTGRFTALPAKGTLYRSRISDETRVTLEQPMFSDDDLVFLYVPAVGANLSDYCATGAPPPIGAPYDTFSYVMSDGQVESAQVTDTISIILNEPPPPLIGTPPVLTMPKNTTEGATFYLPASVPAAGLVTMLTLGAPSTGHLEVAQPDGTRRVMTAADFPIRSPALTSGGRPVFYMPTDPGGRSGEIDTLVQVVPQADGRLAFQFPALPSHGRLEEWMPDGSRRVVTQDDLPLVLPIVHNYAAPIFFVPDPGSAAPAVPSFGHGHSWYDGSFGWVIRTLPAHGKLQFGIGPNWYDVRSVPFNLPYESPQIPLRYVPNPDFTTDGAAPDSFEYVVVGLVGGGRTETCGTGTVQLYVTGP